MKDIADVLIYTQNTSVFIQRSGKRFAMFEHIKDGAKKEKLKLFCATRWESRYRSIQAFVESYEYFITFLEIVGDDNDKAIGAQARGYLKEIKSFKFVFYSNSLMILFKQTHSLANILQSKRLDIAKAIELAEITCSNFISFKTDMDSCNAFNILYDTCTNTCTANNIEVPSDDSRKAKRTRNSNQNIFNSKENFKNNYDQIIDHFIIEIKHFIIDHD